MLQINKKMYHNRKNNYKICTSNLIWNEGKRSLIERHPNRSKRCDLKQSVIPVLQISTPTDLAIQPKSKFSIGYIKTESSLHMFAFTELLLANLLRSG